MTQEAQQVVTPLAALKLALEALEDLNNTNSYWWQEVDQDTVDKIEPTITAIKEALAQPETWEKFCDSNCVWSNHHPDCKLAEQEPVVIDALKYDVARRDSEFFTHCVEQPYDWSEWVCPDPKSYLMKCCDCGLVHEAEFGVVRYKSETEREDCDMVDDTNLQAVFRMRRSEQWSPDDTAHRVGGLPMEQPAQQESVADEFYRMITDRNPKFFPSPQRTWVGLTDEEVKDIVWNLPYEPSQEHIRAIEAKLKEKNT